MKCGFQMKCAPAPYTVIYYIVIYYIVIIYYTVIYIVTLPIFDSFSTPNYQFLSPTILKVPIFDSLKVSIFDS